MHTDKNLQFITRRILETNVALMHCFTSSLLTIPNSIVTTYKVDPNGCIWFFIGRPKHVVSQLDKEFPVNLNYFKKEEATEGDNEPIGIILGAHKNHILVEYATDSITNKVLLSKYQLYLPDKKALQNALDKLLEN